MTNPLFSRFTVIPAIDLKGGKVVRLLRGEMSRATVYDDDPAATARRFEREGAELIHIVDLDGAIVGAPQNLEAIHAIRDAVGCRLDISGGLRSLDSICATIAAGADFVSLGSAAFLEPQVMVEACAKFPERIFGSLDARDGHLAIRGWVETSQLTVADAISRFCAAGAAAIVLTDIARDGTEAGANAAMFSANAKKAGLPLIASGGVATLDDIRVLARCFDAGVAGVISGRALYEGRFSLAEAIAAARG
ncbi:MAG TPA: 1-(5-phosphoribosyl)-5-[(5-phosphoribosylamino)methylideneamino] imidazole-4-carboxamide isomerase [Candidatus Binataceae bacterium]|nr:1-(5-phosphoribosyl)-5-[(5-phosphoribosylamino)methylideneamino] imidazole-4-carboxamide isomerase [Candidatus Binataceae bacterium]